jgi:hypothetical protein
MFSIPVHVWLGISYSGQDKMPYHKRKYPITQEIKPVYTKHLKSPIKYIQRKMEYFPKERQKGQGCGAGNR